MKLIVRDSFAYINKKEDEQFEMPSGGMHILTEDGRYMFGIMLNKDGSLHIDGGDICKVDGVLLDSKFIIKPISSNCVELIKPEL